MNKEFKRMMQLAGLAEIKINAPTQYYAIFNYTFNNDNVYYLITLSKEEMVKKLNKAYKELAVGNPPYALQDMKEYYFPDGTHHLDPPS